MILMTTTILAFLSVSAVAASATDAVPVRAVETGIAKGLAEYNRIYPEAGTVGIQEAVQECYGKQKSSPDLEGLAYCASMDKRATDEDRVFSSQFGTPRVKFFNGKQADSRLKTGIKFLKTDRAAVKALLAAINEV